MLMAPGNESHTKSFKNPDKVKFKILHEKSKKHLRKVYEEVDQKFIKQKLIQKWNVLMFCGIVVTEDEDELIFEFNALWKRIKLKGKFFIKVLENKGSFVLLKYWLPPSIEVPQIWPNEKAINNNELVQIIRHVNKEVRAFHSRSEQLKELEDGCKQMKLEIFYPESRKVVVLTIIVNSTGTDDEMEYTLILKYKSVGCLPFDVSLEGDDIPNEDKKNLLHQASVFKKMFLWQAFCKYTFHSDSSPTSSEKDDDSKKSQGSKINDSSLSTISEEMSERNSSNSY